MVAWMLNVKQELSCHPAKGSILLFLQNGCVEIHAITKTIWMWMEVIFSANP
jgi:hypothetical protein